MGSKNVPSDRPLDVDPIFQWLVDGAPGAREPEEVCTQLCERLIAAGVDLCHTTIFVRTLHPNVLGRSFSWTPGEGTVIAELPFGWIHQENTLSKLVGKIVCERDFIEDVGVFTGSTRARASLGQPLAFANGEVHAALWSTSREGGFTEPERRALEKIRAPLSRVAEALAMKRNAKNLLDTYVGPQAGDRILRGKIRRGDLETIRAVIWVSDLRGFTALAESRSGEDLIQLLNDHFDCLVPAIEEHGGEVLKFMGDGLLAMFPTPDDAEGERRVVNVAREAARDAWARTRALNANRPAGSPELRFGLGLHVGRIHYGNVGGSNRLDFTAIGRAVNLAARLETLTPVLDADVVVSARFAGLCDTGTRSRGSFELKGFEEPQEAFTFTD